MKKFISKVKSAFRALGDLLSAPITTIRILWEESKDADDYTSGATGDDWRGEV